MGAEENFQSRVLKYLNSIEGCCAENVSGNSQQSGRADINGVYRGRSFRIELKIMGNKPTCKQMLNLMKWFKSGSAICVAYDIDDVIMFLRCMDSEALWQNITGNYASFGCYKNGVNSYEFFKTYRELYTQD